MRRGFLSEDAHERILAQICKGVIEAEGKLFQEILIQYFVSIGKLFNTNDWLEVQELNFSLLEDTAIFCDVGFRRMVVLGDLREGLRRCSFALRDSFGQIRRAYTAHPVGTDWGDSLRVWQSFEAFIVFIGPCSDLGGASIS